MDSSKELTFQELLIDLATNFINLPIHEIDQGIIQALRQILEYTGALRCSINQLTEDRSHYERLYRWSHVPFALDTQTYIKTPNRDRTIPLFERGQPLIIGNLADGEYQEIANLLKPYGGEALVAVPLSNDKGLFGFISMSWEKPRLLGSEITDMLRLVGVIFLNALSRKQNEQRIQRLNAELEQRVADRTSELMRTNEQLHDEIIGKQQIENALRESQNQLQAILEALPIPLVVIAENGKLLYANPVAVSLFEINLNAPVEAVSVVALNTEDRQRVIEELHSQGMVKELQVHYRPADGSDRTALISIQRFLYAGQSAMIVSIIDVTELKYIQMVEREQRNLTEALLDSAMALTSTLNLDQVVQHILHSLSTVVALDVANLMIVDGEDAIVIGSRDYIPHSRGYKLIHKRFNYKKDFVGQLLLQTHQPVFIPDITQEPRFARIGGGGPVLRSYLGIPIIVGQEMIGFLSLGSQLADYFTQTQARYLQMFAMQAGIAIQNARLYEQAKTIAALEERQRLARDLHDSVTQTLFSASSIAEALPQLVSVNVDKAQSYLHDLHQLTRGAMAEMRSLLIELRPDALAQTELGLLVSQLCDAFTGKTQIEIEKDIQRRIALMPELQVTFYRVLQEALNNIAKHAQATHVYVTLHSLESGTELRIRDDGNGFDPGQITADHFGLKIMKERATESQAKLIIQSTPNQGTEIILRSRS